MDTESNRGLMVQLIKANIEVEKLMDKVFMSNRVVDKLTTVSGSMMSNMATVQRPGKMVQNTKENI